MKNLHAAALAALFGISATAGIFASTTTIASADQGDRGNGHHRNNNGNWQNGQCNTNGSTRRSDSDENGNSDNENNQGNQGNNGARHGQKRGWQNPNNPHYCGNNGNGNCNNGQYNGQHNGQYGQQNGQYNCNPNGGGQGNSVLRGTITSVNGNQVRLMAGFGNFVTINDQPALNNQQTGRVVVGRYVTAYGYYQNGIFYATSLQ